MSDELDPELLSVDASRLLSTEGNLNALATITMRLIEDETMTREQTTRLIGARRALHNFRDVADAIEARRQHAELLAELRTTREAMRDHGPSTGTTRQTGRNIALPRRAPSKETH